MGNEITVKLNTSINEFEEILKQKGFKDTRRFLLNDTYFVLNTLDLKKLTIREILGNCVLLRNITEYNPFEKIYKLTYKKKEINELGEILSQSNISCEVKDLNSGRAFLEALGYKEIMNIKEQNIVYENNGFEIALKDIENGDNLIEIEVSENNEKYNTIEKLKSKLEELEVPIDKSNFFVKKAEIELGKRL